MRHHLTLVRNRYYEKNKKCSRGHGEKEPLRTLGCTTTMENSTEVPLKKLKEQIVVPSNSTSGHLSEENENTNLKRYSFHIKLALFTQPRYENSLCLPKEQIKKLRYK